MLLLELQNDGITFKKHLSFKKHLRFLSFWKFTERLLPVWKLQTIEKSLFLATTFFPKAKKVIKRLQFYHLSLKASTQNLIY